MERRLCPEWTVPLSRVHGAPRTKTVPMREQHATLRAANELRDRKPCD